MNIQKCTWLGIAILCLLGTPQAKADLFDTYPNLRTLVYKEPESPWKLGLGISPLGILKSRYSVGVSLFQVHYISSLFDLELFNAQFSLSQSAKSSSNSQHVVFRNSPKIRFFEVISAGPLVGYEFVSFPNIESRLNKGNYYSPYEGFSSSGLIYGLSISEILNFAGFMLKINQNVYKQTYSVTKSRENWTYDFKDPDLKPLENRESLKAGTVFNVEIAFLF